jgi:predicted RNase H-like HicB family nuclease
MATVETPRSDKARYRIAVHRASGGYIASAAAIPGCECRGLTAVEAIERVRSAIRAHVLTSRLLEGERVVVELEITA